MTLTDEETYTYARTVPFKVAVAVVKALRDNTIPCRVSWPDDRKTATVYVKPDRQRRLDKFIDRFDT